MFVKYTKQLVKLLDQNVPFLTEGYDTIIFQRSATRMTSESSIAPKMLVYSVFLNKLFKNQNRQIVKSYFCINFDVRAEREKRKSAHL